MRHTDRLDARIAAFIACMALASNGFASDPDLTSSDRAAPPVVDHGPSGPGGTPFDNALRIARMLGDETTVAGLLEQQALTPKAPWANVMEAVGAIEAAGEPERAARLLEERARATPGDPRALKALAELWTRSGHADRAVAAWRELEAEEGPLGAVEALALATALDRLGHPDEALHALAAAQAGAPDGASAFWDALGTLAWQAEDGPEALLAYRKLWKSGDRRPSVSLRLMTLANEAGGYDEAVAAATEGYRQNADADELLGVMEIQTAKEDWTGVLRTLALGDARPQAFARNEEFWLMGGEAYARVHDGPAARRAYETVLGLDPSSVVAKVALLEEGLEENDAQLLRDYTGRWVEGAAAQPLLWRPLALALDRVGRSREAVAFFARELHASPGDAMVALEFADALSRSGNELVAWRVRRYATGGLRDRLLTIAREPKPADDDRSLVESAAEVIHDVSGVEAGERWFRAIVGARGRLDSEAALFVAEWCLREDRFDCARWAVSRAFGRDRAAGQPRDTAVDARWRGYRLQLALADDDRGEMKTLLDEPEGLDPSDRIDALVALEWDQKAVVALRDGLDQDPTPDRDRAWRLRLADIEERHAPNGRAGVAYDFIDGLGVYGPEVGAAHDVGPARLMYSASVRELSIQDGSLVQPGGPTTEADAFVLARLTGLRGVGEIGAGIDYQPGSLLPRGTLLVERLLTPRLGATLRVAADDPIVDTGLLRLAAAQSVGEVTARYDVGAFAYGELELHAREDHTRVFHHVANEVGEVAEVGYKILRSEPEWDVGVQALANQRQNVGSLPPELATLVPASDRGGDLSAYLPPSFQLLSIVTHLTRGDFFERYRPDRAPCPRCEWAAGAGVRRPDLDGAVGVQGSASALVASRSYVSAVASFEQGVFGVANQTNAETRVSFTQSF